MAFFNKIGDWWSTMTADPTSILSKGIDIWTQGGWAMIALFVISLFIFAIGFNVLLRLLKRRTSHVPEATWRRWIVEPTDRSGTVGSIFDEVDHVIDAERNSVHDGFEEVRMREMEPFVRDLRLMNIAVGAAPLVGLLGTVTGMLATFDAMSNGGGGDKTMSMIAKGISEALYTTETGLMVALPGVFFHYYLARRLERFKKFLGHAETVWAQEALRHKENRVLDTKDGMVREFARREIAGRLMARLKNQPIKGSAAGAHS